MANGKNPASHKYTVETGIKTPEVSYPQIGFSFFTLIQNTSEVNLMHTSRQPFPSSFSSHNFSSPLQAVNLSASPISNDTFILPILGNISER